MGFGVGSEETAIGMSLVLSCETLKIQRSDLEKLLKLENYNESDKKNLKKILNIYDELITTLDAFLDETSMSKIPKNIEYKYIDFLVKSLLKPIYILERNKPEDIEKELYEIFSIIFKINVYLVDYFNTRNILDNKEKVTFLLNQVTSESNGLEDLIKQNKILSEDLKNKTIHQIYDSDSKNFRKTALMYEVSFYFLVFFLALYFFGYYIEIKSELLNFKFSQQIDDSNKPAFYIQKISLLILSSTLAAFLLKRSFMNRRLADEAYRTAKEIDGLPRYMLGMPEEMKDKIRFDLAYKYFGSGIHHESYTGGENLMHENIKANTDFIRAVKDLSPKTEKTEKDKSE